MPATGRSFLAYARTVPFTLRNPLYHWTHLELKKFFGITTRLDESTAREIWDAANGEAGADAGQRNPAPQQVAVIATTDDPTDSLEHHRQIRKSAIPPVAQASLPVPVIETPAITQAGTPALPTLATGSILLAAGPRRWPLTNSRLEPVGGQAGRGRHTASLLEALTQRLDFFHANGCRLSDHGLRHCYADDCAEDEAGRTFAEARSGRSVTGRRRTSSAVS